MSMNRCEYCNVCVEGQARCPLCGRTVSAKGDCEALYPVNRQEIKDKPKTKIAKWAAVFTLGVVGVCALVNLLTRGSAGGYWFLDIAVIFIYLWVLVLNTVRSKIRGSVKLMLQAGLIGLMLCVFDWNAGRGLWSLNFGIPFASVGFVALVTYIVFTRKLSWSEYIGYMIAVLLFGQGAITSSMLGFTHFAWPGFMAAGYAAATFLLMLTFANGRYKETRMRRFRF